MKILFVSSEVYPFAKTGGLADISYALPRALYSEGHDIRVIMPKYKRIGRVERVITPLLGGLKIPISGKNYSADLYQAHLNDKVPVYFLSQAQFFNRDYLYQTKEGDYSDNDERFIFFNRGVIEILKRIDFRPDIIHCNDWQTALIPVYLKTLYSNDPFFSNTKTILTIHNINYQGIFANAFDKTELPSKYFSIDGLEYYDKINFLKGGIIFSDLVGTFSSTYLAEIQTPKYGNGLEGVVSKHSNKLFSILNGIDEQLWSPETDTFIAENYSVNSLSGKEKCKIALLKELSLPVNPNLPLIGMIMRLEEHKGIELFLEAAERLLSIPLQIIILGKGKLYYQNKLREYQQRFSDRLRVILAFDEQMAHKIEAGADMLLIPSFSEASSLNCLYSMKYGTVPIVRKTGGLADIVQNFSLKTSKGTGIVFKSYSSLSLLKAIRKAITIYNRSDSWQKLKFNGINRDYSWRQFALEYIQIYKQAKKQEIK